jgi:hypothetical protein
MKRLLLAALALLPTLLSAADKEPLPLGIEVVTGYRTDYEYRGFRLSQNVLDAQIQAEIALSNEWVLELGGSYATATSSNDFAEGTGFADFRYEAKQWTAGLATTLHTYSNSFFRDGVDIAPSFTWHLTKDWDITGGIAYDTGAKGFYENVEIAWSKPVTESSFVSTKLGTSFVEDYYDRSGWNDIYARLGYTYNFNKSVSITPFVGTSLATKSRDHADSLYAGVWFEANF